MNSLRVYPTSINARYMEQAADALRKGEIVICPTDTLYALTCDALNQGAIERLCAIKGINPQKQSLSVICSGISQASEYARIDNLAFRYLRSHTPGAFTFILPASTSLPKAFKGRRTVGVRIPGNPVARALAEALGHPILTTSIPADSERLSYDEITMPDEIMMRMEASGASLIIDAGQGDAVPSTIVDLTDSSAPEILRRGRAEF